MSDRHVVIEGCYCRFCEDARVRQKLLSAKAKKQPREHGHFVKKMAEEVPPKPVQVFKVGDRVEGINPVGSNKVLGAKGTICKLNGGISYLVEFEDNIHGWGENDRYWNCKASELKLLEPASKSEPKKDTDEPIRECYFCGRYKRASKGKVQEFDNGKLMHPREEHWVCFDPCIKALNDGGLKVSAR